MNWLRKPTRPAILQLVATLLLATAASAAEPTETSKYVSATHQLVRLRIAAAKQRKLTALKGTDGWVFFVPELRTLTVGPFWNEHARKVSRASNPRNADPLKPIVDFHKQLKQAGIRLLVVPVPAKFAVYPEQLDRHFQPPSQNNHRSNPLPRLDIHQQEFHRLLARQGVEVVDLMPAFLKTRNDQRGPLYCKTDTHWSGQGIVVAANTILERLNDPAWLRKLPRFNSASQTRPVTISGDLARMLDPDNPVTETLPLKFVGQPRKQQRPAPIPVSRNSPVLLIGDSHTLVFHDPTLHAQGAGLPDHLAAGLGIGIDLIGVRGSGATATRISLLRRNDNLKGKKLVIWCFSIREYTESFSGWRTVPVVRR